MAVILDVISRTFQSFFYIFLLLILFIYIFALLGMSIFGGEFDSEIRQNYDYFTNAFICVFQIVTLENWNDILYAALQSNVNYIFTLVYLVLWIFIGNYVFLNLFLAILLEGFEKRQMDEDVKELENEIEVDQNIKFDDPASKFQKTFMSTMKVMDISSTDVKQKKNHFVYFSEPGICMDALYMFSQDNLFRRLSYRIVKDLKFEALILLAIFASSLVLVLDTYINFDKDVKMGLDYFFVVLFTLEAVIKIIAFGFFFDQFSYLRESWNQLDFFIVVVSWFDIILQSQNTSVSSLQFLKVLRMLRTLRPLRFISHNISMKLVVTALIESVSGILNVVIVILLVWMMFAILGINLMRGKLNYCQFDNYDRLSIYQVREQDCPQYGFWTTYDLNFDNIINGMITLFVLSTLEGWPDYMYHFFDADEVGPRYNSQQLFIIYFVSFILIGSFFLLNLFTGVISLSYNMAAARAKNQYLTDDQSNWIELQRLIVKTQPFFPMHYSPENQFRAFFFHIIKFPLFDPLIMLCIILNIITMSMAYETQSAEYDQLLKQINLSFTIVFIIEAVFKLLAFGIRGYFKNGWNKFDFFVVMASIVDLIMLNTNQTSLQGLSAGPQIARGFRILRLSRLLRLVKKFQGLQKLIQTAIYSLPSLLNVLSLLMLNFFIFSILAVQLFGQIKKGQIIGEFSNFSNFSNAFLLLLTSCTGEDWHKVMFDTARLPPRCEEGINCGSKLNIFFFIIFIVIQQFIMLNLFVLIILQQFEQNYINPDNPLQNFSDMESIFLDSWVIFTEKEKGQRMNQKQLVEFMMTLKKPLGLDSEQECQNSLKIWKEHQKTVTEEQEKAKNDKLRAILKKDAAKYIMQMNIFTDQQGFVHYNEVLYFFMKNYMFQQMDNRKVETKAKGDEIVLEEEQKSMLKLKQKDKKKGEQIETVAVNPVVQFLFVSLSFKIWRSFLREYQKKRQKHTEEDSYFSSSYGESGEDKDDVIIIPRDDEQDYDIEEDDEWEEKYVYLPNTDIYKEEYMIGNPRNSLNGNGIKKSTLIQQSNDGRIQVFSYD